MPSSPARYRRGATRRARAVASVPGTETMTSALSPRDRPATQATRWRQLRAELTRLANPAKAKFLAGYFKTGAGQYGAGDRFLGIVTPELRRLAKEHAGLSAAYCTRLLRSAHNEKRMLALMILTAQYEAADGAGRRRIYALYLANRRRINNWNLVDASAPYIVGMHVLERSRVPLYALARSPSLWDRRIAVLASFALIRRGEFSDALRLIGTLLNDEEDLLHKACGWMLREIGKRDAGVLERFLRRHHDRMPRTMLRYAIERFTAARRRAYLAGRIA